jgi:MYXO-CTERM domain-containing protein
MKFFLPLTLGFTVLIGVAPAVVVNFDFNLRLDNDDDSNVVTDTYVGLGAAPDSAGNTHWNSVRRAGSTSFSSSSALNSPTFDSASVASSVSVSVAATGLTNATIAHSKESLDQELGGYGNLMGDFLQLHSATPGTVGSAAGTISNLTPNASYEIYFYGQGATYGLPGNSNSGQNSLFAITDTLGGSTIGTAEQTGWDGVDGGDGTLTEGVEYVKFLVNANASGQVFFRWENVIAGVNVATDQATNGSGNSSDFGALNGIQIVSVPETSSALLGSLGVFGLLLRRRR